MTTDTRPENFKAMIDTDRNHLPPGARRESGGDNHV